MFRPVRAIGNDIIRVTNYIRAYPSGHWFKEDMISLLPKLELEYEKALRHWEKLEENE